MWNKYTTSGVYPDLDRFNRVTSSRWTRDLATDRDFYSLDVVYDRDSNITRTKDNVYSAGQDVVFTMDNLNRLTDAQRGTWNGSTITSEVRQETWTLDQVGNWDRDKLDLENDNDYNGPGEFNDKRTHDVVNELTGRDTDDSGTDNYTLTYDDDGNLTDDGAQYKNVWDPFGRLRKVKNQSNTVIAEFRYNGLGWRITMLEDTDLDGDADGSDKIIHLMYDENWRIIATFRETDAYPKERFVYHAPGLGGRGASDNLILRDKDANTAWTAASDATLEQRRYYTHNWRGDVATIFTDLGAPVETVRYDAYGECTGVPWGDADGAGATNNTDATQIQTWIDGPTYDVRGDVDGDGDVDSADKAIVVAASGTNLGRGALSTVGSRRGYGAYERDVNLAVLYHVRNRVYNTTLGRWTRRDPIGYVDGMNLYEYAIHNPVRYKDAKGLACCSATSTDIAMDRADNARLAPGPSNPSSSCSGALLDASNLAYDSTKSAINPPNPPPGTPPGPFPVPPGTPIPSPCHGQTCVRTWERIISVSADVTIPDDCDFPLGPALIIADAFCWSQVPHPQPDATVDCPGPTCLCWPFPFPFDPAVDCHSLPSLTYDLSFSVPGCELCVRCTVARERCQITGLCVTATGWPSPPSYPIGPAAGLKKMKEY